MLTFARVVGLVVGVFVGVVIDEQFFEGSPEWTAAIAPTVLAVAGWVLAGYLVRLVRRHRTARA